MKIEDSPGLYTDKDRRDCHSQMKYVVAAVVDDAMNMLPPG